MSRTEPSNGALPDVAMPQAAGLGGQPANVHSAFDQLVAERHRAVPVVGSGLAQAAGVPGAAALAGLLQQAAGRDPDASADLFALADELVTDHGRRWLNEQVAATLRAHPPHPTAALRALARTPSGIIATTNYDDAIEMAAQAVGRTARTFHGRTLNQGLQPPPEGTVHVLHLHGHHDDPDSIILDRGAYEQALDDPALTFALRQLASEHVLVFLGQRLADAEVDLRDNLLWSVDTFTEPGTHHILLPAEQTDRPDLDALAADGAEIVVTAYPNPDRRHHTIDLAAQHLGLGAPSTGRTLPADLRAHRTDTYLPLPIVPAAELSDPSQRRAWEIAGSAFNRHLDLTDVLTHRCAILFGAPGAGKTQTLLAAAQDADRAHVVFKRLRDVRPATVPVAAVDEFVSWVRTGSTLDGAPDPTHDRLADTVYLFLLDGLDEVPRADRDRVLEIIAEVARTYDHLLLLVSSRPYHGALDAVPFGFAPFELVPDRTWFHAYVESVGLADEQLARTLPDDALLQDLVRLPVFAAAVVDAARSDQPLPESPTEAILTVARAGLDDAPTLLRPVDDLTDWLDTLALVAQARGEVGLPVDIATSPLIAQPFDLHPDSELLDELIQRALVVSTGGTVSFPATVVQEARAARALLGSTHGLDLLRRHALLTLPDGTPGVHPDWRHVVELAGLDAPRTWRNTIAEFDARLAARTTPTNADEDERAAAVTTLLDWYDQRLVWWIDHDESQLLTDLDAIVRLAADPELRARAVVWATTRLTDPERTRRGNALQLLLALGENEPVERAMPQLLQDPHTVVRRFAAQAHAHLELTGHADLLRAALDANPDELEERWLLGEYIRTAPTDELAALLAGRWPSQMDSYRATTALDARFDRRAQLALLKATGRPADDLVEHLLAQDEPAWTAEEAAALAAHLTNHATHARTHWQRARRVLQEHLAATLPVLEAGDPPTARYLLLGATTTQLRHALEADLPTELADEIADRISHQHAAAATADEPDYLPNPEPADPGPSIDTIIHGGVDVVTTLTSAELGRILDGHPDNPDLRLLAEDAWRRAQAQEGGPTAGIHRVSDHEIRIRDGALVVLELAAHFRLDLRSDDWAALLRLGWPGREFDDWLREQVPPDVDRHLDVSELDRDGLRQAAWVLPSDTIPSDVATGLLARLDEVDERTAYRRYLTELAEAGRTDIVRDAHSARPDDATLAALVRTGDCEAERQLLTTETEADVPRRWTAAYGDHWLQHVSCPESVDLLVSRIVQAESTPDADYSYPATLHAALHRAADLDGLRVYDRLMAEREYEAAPFLWFRRADLLDKLLSQAGQWEADESNLRELVEMVSRPAR